MTNSNQEINNQKKRRWIVIISVTIFVLSLTQNAVTYQDFEGIKSFPSISLFLVGSVAILGGGLLEWLIWLANPLYIISIVFFLRNKRSSKRFIYGASFLSLIFLFWTKILVSESGLEAQIISKGIGYWLWLISILILAVGILSHFKSDITDDSSTKAKLSSLETVEQKYWDKINEQIEQDKKDTETEP